jgi:hypothetical protein
MEELRVDAGAARDLVARLREKSAASCTRSPDSQMAEAVPESVMSTPGILTQR